MSHSLETHTAQGRRPSRRDPLLGTWLDHRFLIEEQIAIGGFGAVYRGRTGGGAPVALKVLHPTLTGDPSMVARFRREGATLTQLHDPHTVTTFAVGETGDGTLYIAMELLSGENLHERMLRERVLPWQTVAGLSRAVCSSLAEAHALGVVHRDLKPANIHLEIRNGAEFVKVIDFGIVKIARGSAIDDGQDLTCAGHMIGTNDYMSPEQIVGEPCDAASDIYSLGVVMYEMLTGQRPFARAATPTALMTAMLTLTPEPPSLASAIPAPLDRLVMRCLEREPGRRFASAAELAAALDRVIAEARTRDDGAHLAPAAGDTSNDTSAADDLGPTQLNATLVDDALAWATHDASPPDACELPTASRPSPRPRTLPRLSAIMPPAPSPIAAGMRPVGRGSGPLVRHPDATPRPVLHRPDATPRPVLHRPDATPGPVLHRPDTTPGPLVHRPEATPTPPAPPTFATLQGVAVPPERRSGPAVAGSGPAPVMAGPAAASSPAVPLAPPASRQTTRVPLSATAVPWSALTSGPRAVVRARSFRALWLALALVSAAVIALATLVG